MFEIIQFDRTVCKKKKKKKKKKKERKLRERVLNVSKY